MSLMKQHGSAAGRMTVVVAAAVAVTMGWVLFQAWTSWNAVERLAFDTEGAREVLIRQRATAPSEDAAVGDEPVPPSGLFDDTTAFLIVGSDERSASDLSRRADVIMVFVVPARGGDPVLFSLPRDLWIANPCTGGRTRINANLNGCGDRISGPVQLTIAVEDFTGIAIDHFAVMNFSGFRSVIDRVGGVEICVPNQVRDARAKLDLPAGCTMANGAQALSWVRSRRTQEFVDGVWKSIPGVDDLTRNQRQQDLLLEALRRLQGFANLAELSALIDDVAAAVIIDDQLSLRQAALLAWDMRSIDPRRIVRLEIPIGWMVNDHGETVLVPVESFERTLRAAYPETERIIGAGGVADDSGEGDGAPQS